MRRNSSGTSWDSGPTAGTSIPIGQFFVAKPGDDVQAINNALSQGKNLIFTPGVYSIDKTIKVKRADTVVLGLGFATLVPQGGVVPMTVADVPGVEISGLIFDAGPTAHRCCCRSAPRTPQERRRTIRRRCTTSSSGSAEPPPARRP